MLIRTLSVAALTTYAAAQSLPIQPRSIDDILPESTYAAFRFGGLEACKQATGQLPLARLVHTFLGNVPEHLREAQLEEHLDEAAEEVREKLKRAGVKPADVRAVLGQPMAIAVGRLSIEGMGPSVALLIEEGNQRDAINRSMRAISLLLPRMGVDVEIDRAKVAGRDFYRVQAAEGPPVFAGSIGGHYCLSNSRGYLAEIAAVAADQRQSLKAGTVGMLQRQLPAPPLVSWMANASSIMDSLAPHLPYEAGDFADAIGLGRLDMIYAAATASERGGTDLLHVGIGGSESGLAKALVAAPADLSFADVCSSNTIVFGAGSFDIPSVIDAFQGFVELLPDEAQREMKREMLGEMAREMRRMGTSPREVHGILRAFGNQIGFAVGLEKGAVPKPELLVRLAVRDPKPIVGLLQRIEGIAAERGHVEWRSRKAGDDVVRFFNAQVEGKLQLSPCYCLRADGLWIGSDVAGLVRSMRRSNKPERSLSAQEDFQQMAATAAGASGVLHVRTFRGIEIGWRSVETMLYPMLDAHGDDLGFDSESLPTGEELAEALGVTTMVYRVDDDGVTVKTEGPLGLGSLLAAIGSLGHEVLSRASAQIF